jgi:predicted AAA+ superfamily ATPase
MDLIESGGYFTINRPRQYGKTMMLFQMLDYLKIATEYLPIKLDFQGVETSIQKSEVAFCLMFWGKLIGAIELLYDNLATEIKALGEVETLNDLSNKISALKKITPKKIVLLIDKVDTSSNYEAFLKFLAMLRSKYLERRNVSTFHQQFSV